MSDWNSTQYLKFEKERTQPSVDLINRIVIKNPQKMIDIGCGPGNSTNALKERFPNAYVLGIDNSPNMIEKAKKDYPNIDFMFCDANKDLDKLDNDFDVVFSNACIQWLPNHYQLLKNMMGRLKKDGVLAVQLPYNFDNPIHKVINQVASSEKWKLKSKHSQTSNVLTQEEYYDVLSEISTGFSIWQTTYFHTMKSHNDFIEWYRGTGLRLYLDVLPEQEKTIFEQDILNEITKAYPIQKNGNIIFRFTRLFFTAGK